MKSVIYLLDEILEKAFIKAGFSAGFGHVNVSSRPDLCEYQCNSSLALAKIEHKKPIDIANAVVNTVLDDEDLSRAFLKISACMPGFINMDLSSELLASRLLVMARDPDMGLEKDDPPKKIIVDYGGANVAKPLHVGHLRSAVIGEVIKRLGAAFGNTMIGDIHLGDWGTQMGLIYTELKDRGMEDDFTLKDLEEIYPAASRRSKATDENNILTDDARDFKTRALDATKALQNKDKKVLAVWKKIMALSLPDLKKNYDSLDVHFDLWKGESDVQQYIPDMLDSFVKKGIAYVSDGALVVDIQEDGDLKKLPPCIVRKSDGSALYATTDLATLVDREKSYSPDAYIYVADQRQSLHYMSFFRVAKKAGIVRENTDLRFLGFGTVNGRDGKALKTREGGIMRLETLVNDINDAAYAKVMASRKKEEISDEEALKIAKTVGLAALKYGDLSNQASKDYVFDPDRFTNFDGNTGPYILYTIVRIKSILKKAAADSEALRVVDADPEAPIPKPALKSQDTTWTTNVDPDSSTATFRLPNKPLAASKDTDCPISETTCDPAYLSLDSSSLKDAISSVPALKHLVLILLRYPEASLISWKELSPHKLCQFIYGLADAVNTFYHEVKVLTEVDADRKNIYLSVLSITYEVLMQSIHMLGFSAPDKM